MNEQTHTPAEWEKELTEARETIARYREDEKKRAEAARALEDKQALQSRMDAALDGRAFVHARLNDLILEDFRLALEAPANAGLSDREIFDRLTEGQGYFASQNPEIPEMLLPERVSDVEAGMAKMRSVMGIEQ